MVFLAADHAGFELKEKIKESLIKSGIQIEDCGAFKYDEADDYPDYINIAAKKVSQNPENMAIVLGGSGQGEAIVANKFVNVRACVYYGKITEIPSLARQHNNANILSLGARFITDDEAINAVKLFLDTPFSNEERHLRRIEKINKIIEN